MMNLLLSILVPAVLATSPLSDPCGIPAGYQNQVWVSESNMLIGFATDLEVYPPFGYAQFYLVIENTGTETFYLNWGIDPQNGFFVLPDTCTSVNQPGCYDVKLYYYPTILYYYSDGTTLEPGECRVWTETWDILNWGGAPPPLGDYTVLGGMFEPDVTPPYGVGEFVLPVGGAPLTITIDWAIPVDEKTWGQVKTLYR